ncbi:hypothetical protein [Streptomyces sp. BBFR102]|uniref:hypothetical protein n=1 Tax=Streptomyces sp. BBFR102 TaxID=3448171 RepID=UPI003F53A808
MSANRVIVLGKRGADATPAACPVLSRTGSTSTAPSAGVPAAARRPSRSAVSPGGTGMEYGGVTPVGLLAGRPLLLDPASAAAL